MIHFNLMSDISQHLAGLAASMLAHKRWGSNYIHSKSDKRKLAGITKETPKKDQVKKTISKRKSSNHSVKKEKPDKFDPKSVAKKLLNGA